MDALLLVSLTHMSQGGMISTVLWQDCSVCVELCSHSCCTTAQLCWVSRCQSPTAVHSPGDKLQDPSSGLLQRWVTEISHCFLKLHKAEF